MLSVTQPVALRLVCNGSRASCYSNCLSAIPSLSQTATLHSWGLPCVPNGQRDASYEGRGAHRDVYRIGEGFVLKLCTSDSEERHQCNHHEAAALQATRQLPQTPLLYFNGVCAVEGFDSVTLVVRALLVSYGGSSFAKLMHKYFALPYDRTVAEFFVTAYHNLTTLVIDGAQQGITYTDLQTSDISTLSDPTQHVPWDTIPIVFVDAEGIRFAMLDRAVFNRCVDDMISCFELRCACAQHPSWHFLAKEVSNTLLALFRKHGNLDFGALRTICGQMFRLLWLNVCKEAARSESLDLALPAKRARCA